MSWKIVTPQIKTLLETIDKFQEVSPDPTLKFSGYPAACIYPSDSISDYETTTENERVYAYKVQVFYETKKGGIAEAMAALRELVDDVIDLFDQDDLKGAATRTVAIGLPARYTFLQILAHPSEWGEIPGENLITATITVRIKISYDAS